MQDHHRLGNWGEEAAERLLLSHGLTLIERQFRTPLGEIDRIFRDGEVWVFVEVKTRAHLSDFPAVDAVTRAKRRRIISAAMMYMKKHRLEGQSMRFDIVLFEGDSYDWIVDAFEGSERYTY